VKLRKRISWLMRTLQRSLFPKLQDSWSDPLTEKEKRLVSILELLQVVRFVPETFLIRQSVPSGPVEGFDPNSPSVTH
jgi:hypothetical protein